MHLLLHKATWLVMAAAAVLSLTVGAALAHEGREVGEYRFIVGWVEEPTYEGFRNGVDLRVNKVVPMDGAPAMEGAPSEAMSGTMAMAMDGSMDHGGGMTVPVEGLENTLQVEVVHPGTGASRTMGLYAVFGMPGHYRADLIPTEPGVYVFRVFGTVEGVPVDESFQSAGAGGQFNDVWTASELHFPNPQPSVRELESAVRGALTTAQQAQDAALAAGDDDSSAEYLAIMALVLGALGLGAVLLAWVKR